MKFHSIVLVLITLITVGCTTDGIYTSSLPSGEIQFLLVPIMSDRNPHPKNDLPGELRNGFQTSDLDVVQSLYGIKPIGGVKKLPLPNYVGVFTKNGEMVSNFFINQELSQLHTAKGNFEIDHSIFTKNMDSYSPLQTVVCVAKDKTSAVKLRDILKRNGIFLEILGDNPNEPAWAKFDGKMVISLAHSLSSKEELEKELKVCMGNCKVAEVFTKNGVMNCEIYCNGLKKELPSDYRLVTDYQNFKNIEIVSLGTDKEKIEAIIKKSNIENIRVK